MSATTQVRRWLNNRIGETFSRVIMEFDNRVHDFNNRKRFWAAFRTLTGESDPKLREFEVNAAMELVWVGEECLEEELVEANAAEEGGADSAPPEFFLSLSHAQLLRIEDEHQ